MEVRCPSCGAQHRSEDYPGAFDILCGCGYLILNPDLEAAPAESQEINFEGPPLVTGSSPIPVAVPSFDEANLNLDMGGGTESFTAESLTPPEQLPEGMLYDPTEVPEGTDIFKPEKPAEISQVFVERVQKASMGQILGPDYDLEISNLEQNSKLKAREKVQKFLQDHKWLREIMERRSFIIENLFQDDKLEQVPEALAVEIYTACLENGGKCTFQRSTR